MKNSIIVLLVFVWSISFGQNKNENLTPQLNYLLSPVETLVVFDLGEGLMKDTDFDLDFSRMILFPLNKDTTLEMGTKKYSVSLPLERPTLVRIHIADQWDHLFLIPGQTTHVTYNPLKANQDRIDVLSPENVKEINNYYDARFRLLGVSREIPQAYGAYNDLFSTPLEAKKEYDLLAKKQIDLLKLFSDTLPAWFLEFEEKSIKYITETFKLISIFRKNLEMKDHHVDDYSSFELSQDLNDTVAVLTNYYVWSLGYLGYLRYCDDDCFNDLEIRLPAIDKAILKMSDNIKNPIIKQLFLSKNLIRKYSSSHSGDEEVIKAYEDKLDEPYLDIVSIYKNPPLKGTNATSFYLSDTAGKFYTLKSFKDQVVLLNFWFVGCKPCEMELPHEKELVRELQGKDFRLVNICTNTPEDAWKEFIEKNDMPGLNLYAKGNWGSKLVDVYQVSAFPTYVLIDKEGKIAMDKAPRPSGERLIWEIRKQLD